MRHERFQWDTAKAQANLKRHRVAFDEAAVVLADPFADLFHLEDWQQHHGEDRCVTIACHPQKSLDRPGHYLDTTTR